MTPDEVVAEARTWIGVPYRKRGRSRTAGVDCLGLLVMVGIHFNVPHRDEPNYSDWPDPSYRILRTLDRYLKIVPGEPHPGMVGVFANSRLPGHTGFFSELHGSLHVIHARMDVRKVAEHEFRQGRFFTDARLIRVYAFPDLEL
jgi:hypothetical protein